VVRDADHSVKVDGFEFDEVNTQHIAGHGVTLDNIYDVFMNRPQYFYSTPEHPDTRVMLGPDFTGRFYVVAIVHTGVGRVWRPVTAYPYTRRRALRRYKE
jgi:uncharacterized DUF497 family protein